MTHFALLVSAITFILVLFQNCANPTGYSQDSHSSNPQPTVIEEYDESVQEISPTDPAGGGGNGSGMPRFDSRGCPSKSIQWTVGTRTCAVIYPNLPHRMEPYVFTDSTGASIGRLTVTCSDTKLTELKEFPKTCVLNPDSPQSGGQTQKRSDM